MQSSAARREEIQKRLQLIKDQWDREQKAFETLAAEGSDLPAEEIAAIAAKKAAEDVPKTLRVNDETTLTVNEYVKVLNDAALLYKAEHGFLIADSVKRIYLGEKGRILRVMPSFQGKPAVELRFADGAEKVFFIECLDVGVAAGGKIVREMPVATAPRTSSVDAFTAEADIRKVEAPVALSETPVVPSWGELSMPGRNPARRSSAQGSGVVPPPAATVATLSTAPPLPKQPQQHQQQSEKQPTRQPDTQSCLPPQSQSQPSIGLVKEALSSVPTRRSPHPVREELGRPYNIGEADTELFSGSYRESPELDSLLVTPRPILAAPSSSAKTQYKPMPVFESQIPKRCPPKYVGKFSFEDANTDIPRYAAPGSPLLATRKCLVAGCPPDHSGALEFHPVTLKASVNSLDVMLSVFTRVLNWTALGLQAERLFTEDGREIMWAEAVQDDMKLVVTTGRSVTTTPSGGSFAVRVSSSTLALNAAPTVNARPATPSSKSVVQPSQKAPPQAEQQQPVVAAAMNVQEHAKTPSVRTPITKAKPNAADSRTAPAAQLSKSPSAATITTPKGGLSKMIHIKVYENGVYEGDQYECIYRTVTVRLTYKNMTALKTLIGRELQWRDGKKVDILFDASGVEIDSLDKLSDGCAVIASAGDRFIIPFPNTDLHREAMRLSYCV